MILSAYPDFDISMFLNNNGLSFKNYDKEITIDCPFCVFHGKTPDKEKKLWLNADKNLYICFRCDSRGTVQKLIATIKRIPQEEAMKILQGERARNWQFLRSNLNIPKYIPDLPELDLKEMELPFGFVSFNIEDESDYLKSRDIPMSYAVENSWGHSTSGYSKDRLIVPYFDDEGKIIFYQARLMREPNDNEQKVLNPKGISSKKIFYNFNKIEKNTSVYLVEGFMDAAKIESLGLCALALNGKTLGVEQIRLLQRTKIEKISIVLDLDAVEQAEKIRKDLLSFEYEVDLIKMKDSRDCGDYEWESEELRNLLNKGVENLD